MEDLQEKQKLVVIESPFRGTGKTPEIDAQLNLTYAQMALKDSIERGECPIASHLIYPQVLDDNNPCERTLGIVLGLQWGRYAHFIAVYTDRGISEGMQKGINYWKSLGKDIVYRELR